MFSGIFIYSLLFLPHPSLGELPNIQYLFNSQNVSLMHLLPIFLMTSLFCLIEQDLAQCFFAAKNKQTAALAAFYASIFLVLFSIAPVYFGMQTKILNLPVPFGANPLIIFLEQSVHNSIFILAVIALIAAITSTANSLLCAVSAHLTQDFEFHRIQPRYRLIISQIITLVTGLAALITSYCIDQNIYQILTTSYALSVSCLFVPLIVAYFYKPVCRSAAIGAIIGGLSGFIIFRIISIPIPKELLTLAFSVTGYIIGHSLRRF
jgi:SSS family solute:Na+ symporter